MMKEYEINTLSEFIDVIEDLDSKNFYYRGESSLSYKNIIASAYRGYTPYFSKTDKHYVDYQEILDEYYLEIAHELNEIERENFIFYAQHHGLPTPLIDITSNPLTALFFACSSQFGENTARVHLFKKKKLIDMSDFKDKKDINLNKFFFNNTFTLEFYKKICSLEKEIKEQIVYDMLIDFKEGKSPPQFPENQKDPNYIFNTILKNTSLESKDIVDSFKDMFNAYFETNFKMNREVKKFEISLRVKGQDTFFEMYSEKYLKDELALIILFLMKQQIYYLVGDNLYHSLKYPRYLEKDDKYSVLTPLIIMHPTVKFERMRTQEGIFIFQMAHFMGNSKKYIGFSDIKSDIQIIIKDKRKVLIALDRIGVNQKSIFPDHDNIAKYLKDKDLF